MIMHFKETLNKEKIKTQLKQHAISDRCMQYPGTILFFILHISNISKNKKTFEQLIILHTTIFSSSIFLSFIRKYISLNYIYKLRVIFL